ncbi:MAG: hypothetical protein IPJ77_14190 [Planctomycetes bacterium]|nr:hypothetical protein [Planctomycetota bacterium]
MQLWNPEILRAAYDVPLPDWKVTSLAFTPDARRVVVGSTWGRVALLDVETGVTLATLRIPRGAVHDVVVAPDGERVYVVHERALHVVRLPALEIEVSIEGRWRTAAMAGATCLVGGEDGSVGWLDVAAKRVTAAEERHAVPVTALAGGADGGRVVSGAEDGSLIVWDAEKRAPRRKLPARGTAVTALVLDAGRGGVLGGTASGSILRANAASGRSERESLARDEAVLDLAASSDGRRLFSCAGDGLLRVWDAESLLEVATLAQSGGRVDHVALSADGRRVACALDRGVVRVLESRASDLHVPVRTEWLATERRGKGLVTRLARELGSVRAVEERIARDAALSPELRNATVEPLKALRDEARTVLRQSVRVLQQKDEGIAAYRGALQQAERAWRLEPERPFHRDVLALATLRAGDAARALQLLESEAGERPGALAVRALGLARLGRTEEARAAARRARELQRSTPKEKGEDWSAITSELDALLGKDAPR